MPEASWGGSKLVATCEVRHTAPVLEWAAENSDGVLVLSQEQQAALVATVQLGMRDIVQQRLDGLRTNMAASLGLEVDTLDPRVTAERAEGERKRDALRNRAREADKLLEAAEQKLQEAQNALQDTPSSSTAGVAAKLAVPSRMLLPLAPLESRLSLTSSYAAASQLGAAHEPSVGVAAFLSRAGVDQARDTCRCPGAGGRCVAAAVPACSAEKAGHTWRRRSAWSR